MKSIPFILFILFIFGNAAYMLVNYFINKFSVKENNSSCVCTKNVFGAICLQMLMGYFAHSTICTERTKHKLISYLSLQILIVTYGFVLLSFGKANLFIFIFSSFLICIALVDFYTFIIPDKLLAALTLFAITKNILLKENLLINITISLILGIFLFTIGKLVYKVGKKDSIGFGDIKFLVVLNLFTGYQLFLIGLWLSALIAIPGFYLINYFRDERSIDRRIPFGFFLGITFSILLIMDRNIINLYYKLIGV